MPNSSESPAPVCARCPPSRATSEGRITLSDDRLIVSSGERREERRVTSAEEYRALLLDRFGIDLPDEPCLDRLGKG